MSTNKPDLFNQDECPEIPEVDFEITVTEIVAKPRKLKTLWGGPPPKTSIERLVDGLDDPNFDPEKPYYGKEGTPSSAADDLRSLWAD